MSTPRQGVDTTHTDGPARAVLYLRVSTKEQAEADGAIEGYSIPAQREACERKAHALQSAVVEEFVDRGESAKTSDRPELQRMLAYVKAEAITYVIVHKVDRLARNRADDVTINLALKQAGATLVSCTENIDETPSGLLLHGIMSSIAEFYSRNLANEVIKGSLQKAKSGGTIGKAPTGYLNKRDFADGREVRTVEIDPVRGPLMQWAFEAFATGEWTTRSLLEELTRRGLTSVPGPRTPSKPLSPSNIVRLLRHPYYKGIVVYNGVEYPGKHPPLIGDAVWQQVQDVLDGRVGGEKQRTHRHYLKGTVYCGQCGSRLCVTNAKSRLGRVYPYFFCLGRQQHRTNCTQKSILIEDVEELIEDHYRSVQLGAETISELRYQLRDQLTLRRQEFAHERRFQERRLGRLADEQHKLLQAHYAGAVPLDLLKKEQDRLKREIEGAERRLMATSLAFDRIEANLDQALGMAGDCHAMYVRAPAKLRREINQTFFEKVYIDEDGVAGHELARPFALLLDERIQKTDQDRSNNVLPGPAIPNGALVPTWLSEGQWWPRAWRSNGGKRTTRPILNVAGLKDDWLVGRLGLEPSTLGLKVPCSTR
jgi:site-specific DNA recombinase